MFMRIYEPVKMHFIVIFIQEVLFKVNAMNHFRSNCVYMYVPTQKSRKTEVLQQFKLDFNSLHLIYHVNYDFSCDLPNFSGII